MSELDVARHGCLVFRLWLNVSLWKALGGEAEVAVVFGSVRVNPWYTAALDWLSGLRR